MYNSLPRYIHTPNHWLALLKKYRLEALCALFAIIIPLISIAVYRVNKAPQSSDEVETKVESVKTHANVKKIFVEVSGAVEKPDVYEATPSTRLKDVIAMAGGITKMADADFFARNFNLSRLVSDQEKIYIPTTAEVRSGIFFENKRTLEYLKPISSKQSVEIGSQKSGVNINTSSSTEIESLPGIGTTTAQKIIDNRPYSSAEELVNKKIVNQTTFNKIKNEIEL